MARFGHPPMMRTPVLLRPCPRLHVSPYGWKTHLVALPRYLLTAKRLAAIMPNVFSILVYVSAVGSYIAAVMPNVPLVVRDVSLLIADLSALLPCTRRVARTQIVT